MPGRSPCAAAPPPGTGFLYRSVRAATAATSAALILVVLPAYLILAHSGLTAGQARAGAVLVWAPTR
jgi:hypothetical protein